MKFLQALRQFRISSILDILWPPEEFWWPTDLDHDDTVTPAQSGPGLLDKPVPTPVPTLTPLEVEAAAAEVEAAAAEVADVVAAVLAAAAELRAAAREMQQ